MKKEFSRPNEVLLNGMASDIFYVPANFLRTENMASDKLKIPANFLRNETFYVMKKNLAGL